MTDLIRRADAIEAVENNSYGMGSRASVKAIKALPSADMKSWNGLYIKVYDDDDPQDKAEKLYQICDSDETLAEVAKCIQGYLDEPSAEAVQGEWIECLAYNPDLDADVLYIECDQCGHRPYFSGSYRPKYCEECGARMTKGGDSE